MSDLRGKERAKRSAIIAELSRLSRDGWRNAKPCDYEPLERELVEAPPVRTGLRGNGHLAGWAPRDARWRG